MKSSFFAPVVIPTLCRYEHFVRCIESLKANTYASDTEVYIGLDFPTKESHKEGYNKIKSYINNNLTGFKNVRLYIHEHNLGAINNSLYIMKAALNDHGCFIYSEDDNEFSNNFLSYMNLGLATTKNDPDILAVTGYNYPFFCQNFTGNAYTSNVYFSAWGYAMWKEDFEEFEKGITHSLFEKKYKTLSFMNALKKNAPNQYCYFIKGMLGYVPELVRNNTIPLIDLSYGLYLFMNNKKMLFPVKSKVRNWGYDGSGSNCAEIAFNTNDKVTHRNFNTSCQQLDTDLHFTHIDLEKNLNQYQINTYVGEFFAVPKKELYRTSFAYYLSRILGIDFCRKIFSRKK